MADVLPITEAVRAEGADEVAAVGNHIAGAASAPGRSLGNRAKCAMSAGSNKIAMRSFGSSHAIASLMVSASESLAPARAHSGEILPFRRFCWRGREATWNAR